MENSTNANEGANFYKRNSLYMTIDLTISILCMIIALYITCALIFHEKFIKSNWKRKKFSQMSLAKKYGLLSRFLCVLIGIVSLLRHIITTTQILIDNTVELNNINSSNLLYLKNVCPRISRAGNIVLILGLNLVYLVLWLRQRIFYAQPILKVFNGKVVQQLSNFIIVVWVICLTSIGVSYFVVVRYEYSDGFICVITNATAFGYEFIVGSWAAVSVVMEVILLGLFIHPLYKRNFWSSETHNQKAHLQNKIKKAVILSIICLVSDIVLPLFIKVLLTPEGDMVFTFYNINLVVNHLAIVGCFYQWKMIFFPWKSNKKKEQTLSVSARDNSGTKETQV